jgi:hypothetical protein
LDTGSLLNTSFARRESHVWRPIGRQYCSGTTDRKPARSRELWNTIPADADISGKNGWDPKHFWAMIVYNYDTKSIQIWQPTQKTILTALQQLVENDDWGDPRGYNITINRSGDGLETEYAVQPSPHTELAPAIVQAYRDKKIHLGALYSGGNPFDATVRSESIDPKDFRPDVVAQYEGEFPDDDSDVVPFP